MAFTSNLAPRHPRSIKRRRPQLLCSLDRPTQLAICTGPTCKQSNSANILLSLQELCRDVDAISVEPAGCLGECGNGPNIGISCRGDTPRIQRGVSTIHDLADLLRSLGHTPSSTLLEALENKERGDEAMNAGDTRAALSAYNAAASMLRSRPPLLARVLCNRSAAFCERGLGKEAIEDANEAVGIEPGLAGAWKRKAEAHELLKDIEKAVQAWQMWGRLTGKSEEAARKVKNLRGWRFAIFGG